MRQSWKDVGTVFIVALVLDAIYQIAVQGGIFTLELLITATVLALVPYMVLRDLVSRVARRLGVGKHADRSITNDKEITNVSQATSHSRKAHEHVNRLETRLDQTRGDGDSKRGF